MNPNSVQFSINYLFNDNTVDCPGSALPRSFTLVGHGRMDYGVFSVFSLVFSPSKSFTLACHGKQVYGISHNLFLHHSRDPILDHFSLASIQGNSRALVLSIIRRNQTRILFVLDLAWDSSWGLIAAHQSVMELNVPYTVITGT